ncbi:Eco57I restriction-modification methylase domain-containing protein [Azospirillum sp.]|uniref:Eco57I restriction-modification methylase domain-containing protein n=1 Tax=Azospirillum sp. TaxID=34012 RepID=UPI002D559926|nr:N-6 DNA methylase [Azospirillum sp.]HYF86178.1 N-6 DNA methylase [Azospirillum sp.]
MRHSKQDHGFVAIRFEGGILPSEFLQKVAALGVPKQTEADYGLAKGLKLKDEIGRAWRIALAEWQDYREKRQRQDVKEALAGVSGWLNRLLIDVLGYRDLQPATPASIGERSFPINYWAGTSTIPVLLTTFDYDLDKGSTAFGYEGRRRSPHGLVQEYLNADADALWGLVANGNRIRLLRDNPSLTRPAFIEVDLERLFEEGLYSDFAAMWLTFHFSRVVPRNGKISAAILEQWRDVAQEIGERARENLREGVTEALLQLGNGFIQNPGSENLRAALADGLLSPNAYFQELLRIVYRLLFLSTAEDRGLLLTPETSDRSRNIYEQGYSIERLRERALHRRSYDGHCDLWEGLQVVFHSLAGQKNPIGLPGLGGLFASDECKTINAAKIANAPLLRSIHSLSFFQSGGTLARINYRDMGTEELGSVYESLLELHPVVDVEAAPWRFSFTGFDAGGASRGAERKTTGSYYTPPSLVSVLIDDALKPAIRQKIDQNPTDPIGALLSISVIDPSCGSGHFLLAAARRIAIEIARLKSGSDAPDELERQHALRSVIQHCIYGVDRNPLAVELCRTALWIETIEPGKPLSFLDSHIQCGDSLVGLYGDNLLIAGLPDEAYKEQVHDDAATCRILRQKNRVSNRSMQGVQGSFFDLSSTNGQAASSEIESMPEETLDDVAVKKSLWNAALRNPERKKDELACNMYVAAFYGPKNADTLSNIPVTEDINRVRLGLPARPGVVEWVEKIAETQRFFHWHLAFPAVSQAGGFDVVIGNPPWETLSPDAKEFFAPYLPQIRFMTPTQQESAIDGLLQNPVLARNWSENCISLYSSVRFMRSSGRFKMFAGGNLGKGDFNLFRMFAELSFDATKNGGYFSQVLPEGFYNGANSSQIRKEFFAKSTVYRFYQFENKGRHWWKAVHPETRFCIYAAKKGGSTESFPATFSVYTEDDLDDTKNINISVSLLREFSKETVAIVPFPSQAEASIFSKLFKFNRFSETNSVGLRRVYMREIDMGNDRGLFSEDTSAVPLYEGRMVDQYDHRARRYVSGRGRAAIWEPLRFGSTEKRVAPQWYINEASLPAKVIDRVGAYRVGFCDVTTPYIERSVVATLIPPGVVCGHSVPTICFDAGSEWYYLVLLSIMNSMPVDFMCRKHIKLHLSYTILDGIPFPILEKEDGVTLEICRRVAKLACCGDEMSDFLTLVSSQIGNLDKVIPCEDEGQRFRTQAELEALVARNVFGLSRDEMEYVADSFTKLRESDNRKYGAYRTKSEIMNAWDEIAVLLPA